MTGSGKRRRRLPALSRILLKITGESFESRSRLELVARDIVDAARAGCEIAVVVGGGNIMRGRESALPDRASSDRAGMVATVVNGIVLEQVLGRLAPVCHLSALGIPGIVERYSVRSAREALERREILVLSGGTGNPFFSTDTAAVLRARELGVRAILKGTKVRGVFSADPLKDPGARFYPRLSYEQAAREKLGIMDETAFALCAESRIPIIVFELFEPGNIAGIVKGKEIGSRIC